MRLIALLTAACAAAAFAQEREPTTADPVLAGERAQDVSLTDLSLEDEVMTFRPRRDDLRAGLAETFLGDLFASQVLLENMQIAVLVDDPHKNSFVFNGTFQDAGEHFYTDAPTSVGAFLDPVGAGSVYQVTVVAVTDNQSDWLPNGLSYNGLPLTRIRMDVGMFQADFFQQLGADAPIQPTSSADIEVLSAAFGLFSGNQFLGFTGLAFGNFNNNQLAGVSAVAGANGANITELQMIFVVRITSESLPCPPPAEVTLWPVDNSLVDIDLNEIVPDNIPGVARTYEILSITQDEPVGPDGCDASGIDSDVASIRAQRAGWGNGRVYTINYQRAAGGGVCPGVVTVTVPHDQSDKKVAIDDGQDFESTLCSGPGDINVDGRVDSIDLAALLATWRTDAPASWGDPVFAADIDEDGRIGTTDLALLLANFGRVTDIR